jgi:hypothetical protein
MSAATPADLLAAARKIADAVLYEGYVLYPYRASATKNQVRWQWGVVAPRAWSEAGGCEPWWTQTECLAEPGPDGALFGKVRFMQVRRRLVEQSDGSGGFRAVPSIETAGRLYTSWEEGIEREIDFETRFADVCLEEVTQGFRFPAVRGIDDIHDEGGLVVGRVVRDEAPVQGELRISAERCDAISPLLKFRLRLENATLPARLDADRDGALGGFFVGVHMLLGLRDGKFLSLADPPEWARSIAERCRNQRAWPVLIGEHGRQDVVLSAPIILEDYPQIAPESPGDLCDATEIDEILTLRTMALTDEEKREARATDPRAAAIIGRVESMPSEMLEKLHGAIRYLRGVSAEPAALEGPPCTASDVPWWDPAADTSVNPETDATWVRGVRVAKGSRVRLCPGFRGADAQDMFLAGKTATVEGVFVDVDHKHYLAVTLEDDPAAELCQWHGRFFYFAPDEIEPIRGGAAE